MHEDQDQRRNLSFESHWNGTSGLFVAFLDNEEVGLLSLSKVGKEIAVNFIHVEPHCRRQGIGTAMANQAAEVIKKEERGDRDAIVPQSTGQAKALAASLEHLDIDI